MPINAAAHHGAVGGAHAAHHTLVHHGHVAGAGVVHVHNGMPVPTVAVVPVATWPLLKLLFGVHAGGMSLLVTLAAWLCSL